ncbi:hypothetical protein D9M68_746660 [compost metagenome]
MINNVPSAPFSMALIPPMGKSNPQLRDALKRLSAAKYGRPRAQVEKEIFARLGAGDAAKRAKMDAMKKAQQQRMSGSAPKSGATGSSFLDDWLAKRQQMSATGSVSQSPKASQMPPRQEPARTFEPVQSPVSGGAVSTSNNAPVKPSVLSDRNSVSDLPIAPQQAAAAPKQAASPDKLHLRGEHASHDDEISIKIR